MASPAQSSRSSGSIRSPWWLERRLAALAEDTCDAAVLARGHDARDYAEYLVDIARAVTRAGVRVKVVGTAMPGPHLAWRIQQILNRVPEPKISRTRLAWMVAACAVSSVVCAAATLEPASPQRAGELSRFYWSDSFSNRVGSQAPRPSTKELVQTTTPVAPRGRGGRSRANRSFGPP